jgi:hypothetical protein
VRHAAQRYLHIVGRNKDMISRQRSQESGAEASRPLDP